MKTAEKYIEAMTKWLGMKRSDKSHKPIIDLYNTLKPLPRGYKVTYTDAYCQTTISAAALASGMKDLFAMECGCPEAIKIWKSMGCWVGKTSSPKVGDIVYYDWGSDGVADHVGVVVSISGTTLQVLEGNKNGNVDYRFIDYRSTSIYGFARPKYEQAAKVEEQKTQKEESHTEEKVVVNTTGKDQKYAGDYSCTTSVWMHKTPDIDKKSEDVTCPQGRKVRCYGFYKALTGRTMLKVLDLKTGKEGWISDKCLKRVEG